MSENSVKDILARFNQGSGPPLGPPPAQKPSVQNKPSKFTKPSNLPINNSSANGVKSPSNGVKPPVARGGFPPGGGVNMEDISKVKLKKPPLPKPPADARPSENQIPSFKLQPKPKPKPAAPPRQEPSPPLGSVHSHPKSTPLVPGIPTQNKSSLHANPKPGAVTAKPKPQTPVRKDSLTDKHARPRKPSLSTPSAADEDKENHWKNGTRADEPAPPLSDSENSSASSVTDIPFRRTSFLHTASKKSNDTKPVLEPLPPLLIIGNAPRKPAKPPNVSLAKFLPASSDSPPPPLRPPKPGSTPTTPPSLPARPGGGLAKTRPPPPQPVPEEQIPDDAGDIYDDVEGNLPADVPKTRRPFSLIETMDSDEEAVPGDCDDIYDDAESVATIPVPALPPHPTTPTLSVTGAGSYTAPPLPSISSIPALHGSGGSSISFPPRSAEHSGSGLEEPEIYDDVSADGESDELYEALDVDEERTAEAEREHEREEKKKQEEKRRKEEERLRKEQEKQQKKEEEKRKKKEKEEKKKKEKEEKDLKKRFNLKGEINIIDEGIVLEAMDAEYEKYGLQCEIGEKIEILRKEGNPPGKWLARNPVGHYGYVDHQFVRLEGLDSGEVYDDVIGEEKQTVKPIEPVKSDEEGEEENIYDAVN